MCAYPLLSRFRIIGQRMLLLTPLLLSRPSVCAGSTMQRATRRATTARAIVYHVKRESTRIRMLGPSNESEHRAGEGGVCTRAA